MGCGSSKNAAAQPNGGKQGSQPSPVEKVNVKPADAAPDQAKAAPAGSSTAAATSPPDDTVTAILLDVEDPVRCRSKTDAVPAPSAYDERQQEAASRIGAVARGSRDRQRVKNQYAAERKYKQELATNPVTLGLGDYAETRPSMARINDNLRYEVRDITAKQVLQDLGFNVSQAFGYSRFVDSADFMAAATSVLKEVARQEGFGKLLPGVKTQMGKVVLFSGPSAPPSNSLGSKDGETRPRANTESSVTSLDGGYKVAPEDQYLLGKFDCVAIPARADYDCAFREIVRSTEDCDGKAGFTGWFWVVHTAAPNIGENALADDFLAYSKEDNSMPPQDSSTSQPSSVSSAIEGNAKTSTSRCCWKDKKERLPRRLDEDLYILDMGKLWRNTLRCFVRLEVEDIIVFPFGMGAFLRHLDDNDDNYSDPMAMRKLRRRIADELMAAIDEIIVAPSRKQSGKATQARQRVHLCLVCTNAESIENHNTFVEAAAGRLQTCRELTDILQVRKNTDSLQLAHDLSRRTSLKVGLMNGANRKLCGNHWFQTGARFAIDENLHRRSATMSRAALLLNCAVEPRKRKPGELTQTVEYFSGNVVALETLMPGYKPPAAVQPSQPAAPPLATATAPAKATAPAPAAKEEPCIVRIPVKGDQVLAADGKEKLVGKDAKAWKLAAGGIAIVAQVDKKTCNFKLRNAAGTVSKELLPRKDFVYAKDDIVCKCVINVPLKGDSVVREDGKEMREPLGGPASWTLAAGEAAIVAQLEKSGGGFKLKNAAGKVSKQYYPKKDFVHAKVKPMAGQPAAPKKAGGGGGCCGGGATNAAEPGPPKAKAAAAAPKAAAGGAAPK